MAKILKYVHDKIQQRRPMSTWLNTKALFSPGIPLNNGEFQHVT